MTMKLAQNTAIKTKTLKKYIIKQLLFTLQSMVLPNHQASKQILLHQGRRVFLDKILP